MRKSLSVAFAAALLAAPVHAQVFTPTFQSPVSGSDIGVYVVDMGDLGIEGVFRQRIGTSTDLGLRAGFADVNDATVVLLGADLRSPLRLQSPLALALTAGAQVALADAEGFGIQGGVSVGYPVRGEISFTPYIHPRLALISANDESDLEVEADVGVDVGITPSIDFRFGANLGDGADWGIGLAFRR